MEQAERRYGITFPPSLHAFYAYGLPLSAEKTLYAVLCDRWFPIWNDFSEKNCAEIRNRMEFPLTSLLASGKNGFWPKAWDRRPESNHAVQAAWNRMAAALKRIPVYSHRYLPQMDGADDPHEFLSNRSAGMERDSVSVPVWCEIMG